MNIIVPIKQVPDLVEELEFPFRPASDDIIQIRKELALDEIMH